MHLLSPDVFYGTTPPLPGLLPGRDPQSGAMLPCPLSKPETKHLQQVVRLTASQIRIVLPAAVHSRCSDRWG